MEKHVKLTDNLYAYVWDGNDNNCNTYLFANVLQDNKHIIIDPGHVITPYLREPAYDILVKKINQDELKTDDIGIVLLTHAHPDHFESAQKIKQNNHSLIAMYQTEEQIYQIFGGGKIDLPLKEGELRLDNSVKEKLEIIHTPGHSPGHISLFWPDKKALAVGDVIFYHNTGRVDLPGGDPRLLKESIDKLSKLDVEYLLCGHPYDNPGVIQGKAAVRENFEFLKANIWF
jgi:glyoxylase-like metal-dependent hydrolase (beta-lactamase superfamily II)